MTHTEKILHYNRWANQVVVDHLKTLPQGVCKAQIKSVFSSIFDTLIHIYIIDEGWWSLLKKDFAADDYDTIGKNVQRLVTETQHINLEELEARQQQLAENLLNYVRNNNPHQVEMYASVAMSLEDLVQHIVNHGTYHRGNITAMLRQQGQPGTPTDYGLYLYRQQAL